MNVQKIACSCATDATLRNSCNLVAAAKRRDDATNATLPFRGVALLHSMPGDLLQIAGGFALACEMQLGGWRKGEGLAKAPWRPTDRRSTRPATGHHRPAPMATGWRYFPESPTESTACIALSGRYPPPQGPAKRAARQLGAPLGEGRERKRALTPFRNCAIKSTPCKKMQVKTCR